MNSQNKQLANHDTGMYSVICVSHMNIDICTECLIIEKITKKIIPTCVDDDDPIMIVAIPTSSKRYLKYHFNHGICYIIMGVHCIVALAWPCEL